MTARYGGGNHLNSRRTRALLPDPARANVPADLESVAEAREHAPERVAQLQAAGFEAWLVGDWRVFIRDGVIGRREIRTPSEFAALVGA